MSEVISRTGMSVKKWIKYNYSINVLNDDEQDEQETSSYSKNVDNTFSIEHLKFY